MNTQLFLRKSAKLANFFLNMNFFSLLIFFKCMIFFFCINKLSFYWKSVKFAFYHQLSKQTFFANDFLNARFFWIKLQLFRRIPIKFATNCQNIGFPRPWYFFKCAILSHKFDIIPLKIGKICGWLSKQELSSWLIFLNARFSFFFIFYFKTNTLIFRRKSAKFAVNYQNTNFSCSW